MPIREKEMGIKKSREKTKQYSKSQQYEKYVEFGTSIIA